MTNVLDANGPVAVAYAELSRALYELNQHLIDLVMTTQIMNLEGFRHEDEILAGYLRRVQKSGLALGDLLWPDA